MHRDLVLDGHRQKRGGVNFEIGQRYWNCASHVSLTIVCFQFEVDLFVLGSLAGKLNLQIYVDGRRSGCRFRHARADRDERKLGAAGYLKHVKIPVAVARVKGFHWHRDQELALTCMANAFPFRLMADTLSLMQRV